MKKPRQSIFERKGVERVSMTPMIDVVFLILIYFLATFEPTPVITELDVTTPSKDTIETPNYPSPPVVRILVGVNTYHINSKRVDAPELDRLLNKLGASDPEQLILVSPSSQSPHARMVEVLDLCAKSGLINLSVVSRS